MTFRIMLADGEDVEASIGTAGGRRRIEIDCQGAPWPRTVLGQPLITATIEAWMRSDLRPPRVHWTVLEEMLETAGLGQALRVSSTQPPLS